MTFHSGFLATSTGVGVVYICGQYVCWNSYIGGVGVAIVVGVPICLCAQVDVGLCTFCEFAVLVWDVRTDGCACVIIFRHVRGVG